MREPEHVAIIGGGFSGVALAAELVRGGAGLHVTLVEGGDRLGRGLAYGTPSASHQLNTRADQMGLFADDPMHFLNWQRARGRATHAADFVLRRDYGEYLERSLLAVCSSGSRAPLTVEMQTRATDLVRSADGFAVSLSDGRALLADTVVLATGHPPPADPFGGALRAAPRYVRDPWRHDEIAAIAPADSVLVIGTGLTAVDIVLELEQRGHRGPIHAVSRRGLLPRAHRARREALPADLQARLCAGFALNDLREMVATVRRVAVVAEQRGVGWQAVFDALRPMAPRIWGALCARDRQRFVRWLRPFWDVHRHRLPPGQAGRIAALRARGRLAVHAARLGSAVDCGDSIVAEYTRCARGKVVRERYGWVINCTGSSFAKSTSPPFERQLLERGLLLPDPLGLGYVTGTNGAVMSATGPVRGLFVLGPACRPHFWEHTAVPELRAQAAGLAAQLLERSEPRAIAPPRGLRVAGIAAR